MDDEELIKGFIRVAPPGSVAMGQVPFDGLTKRPSQHGALVLHCPWREAVLSLLIQERLHVLRRQLVEPNPTQCRTDVYSDLRFVRVEGQLAHAGANDVLEPSVKELSKRLLPCRNHLTRVLRIEVRSFVSLRATSRRVRPVDGLTTPFTALVAYRPIAHRLPDRWSLRL